MKIKDFIQQNQSVKFPCIPTCQKYLRYLGYSDSSEYSDEAFRKLLDFLQLDKHTRTSLIYKQTCIERYGENYFKDHGQISKESKIMKYGSDQGKIFMQKAKEAAKKNLGDNYQSEVLKKASKKIKDSKIAKYGDNYASVLAKKAVQTKLQKYGDTYFSEHGKKAYATALANNPNMLEERNAKRKQTCEERYGPDFIELFIENRKSTCIQKYGENFAKLFYEKEIPERLEKYGKLIPSSHRSKGESEIYDYITSIYDGSVIKSCYDIIPPYELDLYIPEKKIAVEFDGFFYHSEAILMNMYPDKDLSDIMYKEVQYKQLRKTELCEKLGIRLIHILDLD